ncbi:hypothetical protein [Mycolicibacterium elephantis]|uniref:Terminase n=1 Tax=Mycolicibacterium elephantis DSM 44368 TaxID=1335622 RepID=A0A439DPP4_9MYCO|nr:hypothetical protein [Mycolicibacterium elephantis]MCV7219848.1 hypothetical protein [Mycolicibacterium elephantis]RWA17586.1 hypothetical protein MELE44368_05420 [Mycolicibacterium elephantis DSM 44368]
MSAATVTTEPTFSRVPAGDEATGQDCIDLATGYGVPLDEWQADIIRGVLRETDGGWSASQAGLVVSRQNGKGQILIALELFGLFELGEQILHTAHSVRTSSDAFRRLWNVIQSHPDLAGRVRRHSQMIGAEYVELDSGARISFSTRSASVGRGLSLDRLIVDEAEDLPAAEVGALAPTVFSRPRAQSIYFGTAPGVTHDAAAFGAMRATAHSGLNPRLAWWEWCADWGHDVDDQAMWVRVNPAVAAGRIPLQAIIDDRAILPVEQFQAERLSMWPPTTARHVPIITESAWEKLRADSPGLDVSPDAFGVDMSHSLHISVVACWMVDDRAHVEELWAGTDVASAVEWIVAAATDTCEVVIDDYSPAAQLIPELKPRRIELRRTNARDMAKGCLLFETRMNAGTLTHRGQQSLTNAVMGAQKRPIGDAGGWGWDRRDSSVAIHQVVAATLALLGATWAGDKPTGEAFFL